MNSGKYNYVEAWQKSILFYMAQRQGRLGKNYPLNWRADSCLDDGKDVGLDLTNSYSDAGDHVYFGLPFAYSISMLGWGALEYKETYIKYKLWDEILGAIKWGSDFLLKCCVGPTKFCGQVGGGQLDHSYWGPPEFIPYKRETFFIDEKNPGSDLAGSASAALSITALIWRDIDLEYSNKCLKHARELFDFGNTYRGRYSESIKDAAAFYSSSSFMDDLLCAALWLFRATGEETYKKFAITNSRDVVVKSFTWVQCWDDRNYEALYLLARFCNDNIAKSAIEKFLDYWCNGITTSPGGLKFLNTWGSLRYSSTAAFMAALYIDKYNPDLSADKKQKYENLLNGQINYILGDNPNKMSYMVGFGSKYPQNPHHRAAHGSWRDSIEMPEKTRHILYGALCGGPNERDAFSDLRNNYIDNEVAMDYNAGFVGALAAMSARYGGEKVIIPPETPGIEYYVTARLTGAQNNAVQMSTKINNNSGWPPAAPQLTFRYFVSSKDITITAPYKQNSKTTISAIKTENNYSYFDVIFQKGAVYPGSVMSSACETQLNISSSKKYDYKNDWSAAGLILNKDVILENVCVYADGVLKFGNPPFKQTEPTPEPTPEPQPTPTPEPQPEPADKDLEQYKSRFLEMYKIISSKYYSKDGGPYHSLEKFIIEAPDHGATSTSEAYSYFIMLEVYNYLLTGDIKPLQNAWNKTEEHIIPLKKYQPTNSFYNPQKPASYAPEWETPDKYPSELNFNIPIGADPICGELQQSYSNKDIYGMHWLLDLDNDYGYGNMADGKSTPSYVNTFQRGEQESVWETVPHPSWEEFKWGEPNSGFLKLFTKDASYAKQWRYTNAPDADARLIQAMYKLLFINKMKPANMRTPDLTTARDLLQKTSKMGDYLRYATFDKYFKAIGSQNLQNADGGYNACHHLISWYYSWGGAIDTNAGWAWRIGCSHVHFGYQNPLSAWILSNTDLTPKSSNAKRDWKNSLDRQIEFYYWLQSKEGAISGGATNSYKGRYEKYPANTPTFYGMMWDPHPVFRDPPSNHWIGWQVWSMQRVAEYYYMTKDTRVKTLLTKWTNWMLSNTEITETDFKYPVDIDWDGQPDTFNKATPFKENADLHVIVRSLGRDVGTAASYIKTLLYWGFGIEDKNIISKAKKMLDLSWKLFRDELGFSIKTLQDFTRLDDGLSIPAGINGKMPSGALLNSSSTFRSIRPMYKDFEAKKDVEMRYHRYWEQVEMTTAILDYYLLSSVKNATPTPEPQPEPTPEPTPEPQPEPVETDLVYKFLSDVIEFIIYPKYGKLKIDTNKKEITYGPYNTKQNDTYTFMDGNTLKKVDILFGVPTIKDITIEQVRESGWATGATLEYKITNNSSSDINGWKIKVVIEDGSISNAWNMIKIDDGIYENEAYNSKIPAGGFITFGMNIQHSGIYNIDLSFL